MSVNLTDTATVTDLTSPEGVDRFNLFYAGYSSRSRLAGGFKALHVYEDSAGFHAVDFDLSARTLEDLAAACEAILLSMRPEDPIPVQPREVWWEFWRVPLIKGYMRYPMRTWRKSSVFLALRGVA